MRLLRHTASNSLIADSYELATNLHFIRRGLLPSEAEQRTSHYGDMNMRPTILHLAAVLLAPTALVRAQAPPLALATSARVRVTAPTVLTPARQPGRVLALRRDSLLLQPDGGSDSLWLPLAAVTDLEVSRGRHASTGKGIVVGLLTGGALGAVVGAATYQAPKPCPPSGLFCLNGFLDPGRGGTALIVGVLGGVVGGVVGGFVGHAHQSERWERVAPGPLASLLGIAPGHVSLTPTGGGAALSVGLRF